MKTIVLLSCLASHWCFGELATNTINVGSLESPLQARNMSPLALKLPMPSMGINGPENPEIGPHVEPYPTTKRAPFLIPVGVTNVALRKKVTSSVEQTIAGTLTQITDGQKEAFDDQVVEMRRGEHWVQIDLEHECNIYAIVIWHDNRYHLAVFRGVVVQAADDAGFTRNVRKLFNNDYELGHGTDKQYFETTEGKLIDAKGIKARYLRFSSNGSNISPLNCYTEIEVWGLRGK